MDEKRINLMISVEEYKALKQYALEVDRSMSSVIRIAVKEYIKKDK